MKRIENLTLGERLTHLMKIHDCESGTSLARRMIKAGLIEVSEIDPDSTLRNAARTINKHLSTKSAADLSGQWINRYCMIFDCSSDYLFGYISSPTHEISTVTELTGLSEAAVNNLSKMKEWEPELGQSSALSVFLAHPGIFKFMDTLVNRFCVDQNQKNHARVDFNGGQGAYFEYSALADYTVTRHLPELFRELTEDFQRERKDYSDLRDNAQSIFANVMQKLGGVKFTCTVTKNNEDHPEE